MGDLYVNDVRVGTTTVTTTSTSTNITFDPPPTVQNGDTVTYTMPSGIWLTDTTPTGTWWGAIPTLPDMTDWPASDIIDHFALDLARRRPA